MLGKNKSVTLERVEFPDDRMFGTLFLIDALYEKGAPLSFFKTRFSVVFAENCVCGGFVRKLGHWRIESIFKSSELSF